MTSIKRHANWEFAEEVLAAVLPGSTSYNHDRIVRIPHDDWEKFDIEERDDDAIEDNFLSRCGVLTGPLIIVNDSSFEPQLGPYFIDASKLTEFVKTFHLRVYNDSFMRPSVFVVAPVTGSVLIVQDDGYFVAVQGRPVWAIQAGLEA